MLVHDESPRLTWKLAVVESLIEGGDGLIRAANILRIEALQYYSCQLCLPSLITTRVYATNSLYKI